MLCHLDTLLDRCRNGLGEPLTGECRQRIHDLDTNPSPGTWNNAYSIHLGGSVHRRTLWTAVLLIDPRCPRSLPDSSSISPDSPKRWSGYYPEKLTLRIALRLVSDPAG